MSNQQHADAKLEGYAGPFFIREGDELHLALANVNYSGLWLDRMLTHMQATKVIRRDRVRTSDDYDWFWRLEWPSRDHGRFQLLLPGTQDWDAHDGTKTDRSLALYTIGCTPFEAAPVLLEIKEAVEAQKLLDAMEVARNN